MYSYFLTKECNALTWMNRYYMEKVHYLVEVVNSPLVPVIVKDDMGLFVLHGTNCSVPMQSAHEKHILPLFGAGGDKSMCVSEHKLRREFGTLSCSQQCRGKLQFVLPHSCHHGQLPPQQLRAKAIGCEKVITCDGVTPKTLCHLENHMPALFFFFGWPSTSLPVYICMLQA